MNINHDLWSRFMAPPNEYRGKPFWSWNGELQEETLLRQLHQFREMGFGGLFMHSRTGLETPYLGEEWMRLTAVCAEEAKKLGMEAWLYDEDRWPSGTAGGRVTEEPGFRARYLRLTVWQAEAYEPSGCDVAAFECRLDGLAFYDARKLTFGERPRGGPGQRVLSFAVETMAEDSFYNGSTYVDTMNREATERFIELTHERYAATCGSQLGSAIQGIFTDEPHRGALMVSGAIGNRGSEWLAPYTDELFPAFKERYGYDLAERLPDLFLQREGVCVSQVKWHYVELLQQLFLDRFVRPLNDWCAAHGIRLTGHALHEDSLAAQTALCGSMMRVYEYMSDPGIDILAEGNRSYWAAKQLSSVARQLGKRWTLSELYGATGWQMSFQGHKNIGDWQALLGVNVRCHHLAWYTMRGEAKRDYPASISPHSAWWREYAHVETYFARLGVVLSEGAVACDWLVVHPVESVWCQVHPGWASWLEPQGDVMLHLEALFRELFHWLSGERIDFDYGDEDLLARYGNVAADASGGQPLLAVGGAAYRGVLVGGLTTMRASTVRLLDAFRAAGGTVVFAGDAPAFVDAVPSKEALRLAERTRAVQWDRTAVAAVCLPLVRHGVTVLNHSGAPIDDVYAQVRVNEGAVTYVLLNLNRERAFQGANVRLGGCVVANDSRLERWDATSGERFEMPFAVEEDGTVNLVWDAFPGGEAIFVWHSHAGEERIPRETRAQKVRSASLDDEVGFKLNEPNVCVLDRAEYRVDGGAWQPADNVLRIDRCVRERFGLPHRGGEMMQPWYSKSVLGREPRPVGRLELRMRFRTGGLENGIGDGSFLALEQPERWRVTMNGMPLSTESGSKTWWIDECFRTFPLPIKAIQPGENEIVLETDFQEDTDLEAIYILGNFGVWLSGAGVPELAPLPATIRLADAAEQGLPFYSGAIAYHIDAATLHSAAQALEASSSEEMRSAVHGADPQTKSRVSWVLETPNVAAAFVRIRSASGSGTERLVGWYPYETDVSGEVERGESLIVETVLTRRNTFGPLHLVPALADAYSPNHFHSEGSGFTTTYALLPSGILEPLRLTMCVD